MLLSTEDKVLIKALRQEKCCWPRKLIAEFPDILTANYSLECRTYCRPSRSTSIRIIQYKSKTQSSLVWWLTCVCRYRSRYVIYSISAIAGMTHQYVVRRWSWCCPAHRHWVMMTWLTLQLKALIHGTLTTRSTFRLACLTPLNATKRYGWQPIYLFLCLRQAWYPAGTAWFIGSLELV